jgi:hypothetical protein
MNKQQKKQIRINAQIIEKLSGKKKYANYVDSDVKNNFKGALIGGVVGVLIAVAVRKNIMVGGIIGLIGGRFLFKMN